MGTGSQRLAKWATLALLLTSSLLLSGCASWFGMGYNLQTTISPRSDFARDIQGLYELIFWMSVAVFVVVEAALVWAVIRYRHRTQDPIPAQVHGNTRLEVAWTIAPAVVLFVITYPTIATIFKWDLTQRPAGDVIEITVIGHQWWWEVRYPSANVVSANEVHIPVGRTVSLALESADVIHSFSIPRLVGKKDVVPNRTNYVYFTADEPGEYYGQCFEFCGIQHANMKFRTVVHSSEEFDAWLSSQQAVPAPADGKAQEGAQLFARGACVGCHTIQGTPAQAKIGPDLTHVGSRLTIGAGMLDNTPENLARWLRDPQEVKPGNQMPNLRLKESEVEALVAYLRNLK